METLNSQLSLMERYGLTAEEVLVIELLFLASIEEDHKEYLVRYYRMSVDKTDLRDMLVSLQNKGIIVKSYKIPARGTAFDPHSIEFNKNFLKVYRKFSGEMGKEFFMEYPTIAIINGNEAPLKNWAKKFNSEDELYFQYGKAIGWKSEEHDRVLELIRWGKENKIGILNMNIADFIVSKMWNSLEELKNGDGILTFDSIETV